MPEHEPFRADLLHQDGDVVVRLTGELDIATAPILRRTVARIAKPHLRGITLDLADLEFVDVVGLHALADARELTAAPGTEFRLSAVTDRTLRIIRLAGFDELEGTVLNA